MSLGKTKWRLLLALAALGYLAVFAAGFKWGKSSAVHEYHHTFVSKQKQKEVLHNGIYILAGSFAEKHKAHELTDRLRQNGYHAMFMDRNREIPLYRVFVGPVKEENLKRTLLNLQRQEKIIGYTVSYARK